MGKKLCKCPMCEGAGVIEEFVGKAVKEKQQAISSHVKALKKGGYSYRDIMRIKKWNSTSVVSYYLNLK